MAQHKSGSLKQKNKPFKGSSKRAQEEKHSGQIGVRKKIFKIEKPQSKDAKLNKLKQLKENKKKLLQKNVEVTNENMLHDAFVEIADKCGQAPKIILLAGFNNSANPGIIRQVEKEMFYGTRDNLIKLLGGSEEEFTLVNSKTVNNDNKMAHEFHYTRIATNPKTSMISSTIQELGPELKTENYIFVVCPRNVSTFLDYCKVADIVCVILSCKEAEQSSLLLDPYVKAKAFDEIGYQMLAMMKAQGLPTVVGVLQDLELIQTSKQNNVKKIYHRFIQSELGDEEKFHCLSNNDEKTYFALMRTLQEINVRELEWREIRSYMLAEKIQVNIENGMLEVEGFLKGNFYNPNQLIHITGYGDYPVSHLEILHNPFLPNYKKEKLAEKLGSIGCEPTGEVLLTFSASEQRESYSIFPDDGTEGLKKVTEVGDNNEESKDQITDEKQGFMPEKMGEENRGDKIWDEAEEAQMGGDDQSDVSFEDHNIDLKQMQEEKKAMREVSKRNEDEREFEDEIDYPTNIYLKDRLKKYTGLKSFRNTEWKPYIGIPKEFEKILIFDDFLKSRKRAVNQAQTDAVAYRGYYVKLYVENFPVNDLPNHDKEKPIVILSSLSSHMKLVSSLLKYERKITILNAKIRREFESSEIVRSKEKVDIQVGFRVFPANPLYSKIFPGVDKSKLEKKTYRDQVYQASFYGQVTFPPANVLIFKTLENGSKELVASGELLPPNPLKVILKRVILCGYPFKMNKRRAVVRMMFFNPIDVKYFLPIELITKNRLRGNITESLGTHGYMKCMFNSMIKGTDTVCLYLYKRVFPKWPFGNNQLNSSDIISQNTN